MKLIVGLGNPGFRYRNTRHNIGFLVIKAISNRFNIPVRKRRYKGLLGGGSIGDERVNLFMPHTYMNLSGIAVEDIARREKIDLKDFLVIYDDINLRFGFIRIRKKGSSGGHKGLESIIMYLGTSKFARLRIGIGENHEIRDAVKFVLSPFDPKERPLLKSIIKGASECAIAWVKDGPEEAMARFNRRQS